MKLGDIIALAKAGYSVADVKELIKMNENKEESTTPTEQATEPAEQSASSDVPPTPTQSDSSGAESVPEESGEIEELKKQLAELEAKLKTAQSANAHTDMSGMSGDKSDLDDIVRSFM